MNFFILLLDLEPSSASIPVLCPTETDITQEKNSKSLQRSDQFIAIVDVVC